MKFSTIIALLLFASMGWGQAQVNEKLETAFIYVDVNTGSDSNPGTASQPLKTIGAATSKALSNNHQGVGSRVIINPGTYRESISMGKNVRSTNLPMTFEAATNGTVLYLALTCGRAGPPTAAIPTFSPKRGLTSGVNAQVRVTRLSSKRLCCGGK